MQDLMNFEDFTGGVNESGYASLANTLRGLRPGIHTIGILSAENPYGEKRSDEYNRAATEKLKKELSKFRLGWRPLRGKYGSEENSLLVPNISKAVLHSIGYQFEQDSVIFGERIEDGDYVGMEFKMIITNPKKPDEIGNIIGEQQVFVHRNNPEDFYSEYKGRKFVIPFFGVEDVTDITDDWKKVRGRSFHKRWEGGSTPFNVDTEYYQHKKTGRTLTPEEYEEGARFIKEATTHAAHALWGYRGRAAKILE